MKSAIFLGVFCSVGMVINTQAACPVNSGDTQIINLTGLGGQLEGYTVCVGSSPNWEAQEYHQAGGTLKDYKHGPQVPKAGQTGVGPWNDWTDQVGTWSVDNDGTPGATVNYQYSYQGNVSTYSYKMYSNGSGQYFCNATNNVPITAKYSGLVSCTTGSP